MNNEINLMQRTSRMDHFYGGFAFSFKPQKQVIKIWNDMWVGKLIYFLNCAESFVLKKDD